MTMYVLPPAYLPNAPARADAARAAVLQSVHISGDLHGLLLEMSVEQHYVNAGATNIEAVYTFPLPWRAVILGMEVVIGEKVLQAAVVATAAAERDYESALERGDTAVMLECSADGVYTVNAGNMLAGEKAIVRLRYAQLLSFEQGQVRIVVPSVIAPRFGSPSGAGLQPHQAPVHQVGADYPLSIQLRLHDDVAAARLQCPTHPMSVRRSERCVEVGTTDGAFLDRDWVLLADQLQGKSLSAMAMDGDQLVVLASFCPAANMQAPQRPLTLKILVDCSGSMNGSSIDSARRALHEVLQYLEPDDRFTYSKFGDTVLHDTDALTPATPWAIRHAALCVAQTQADMGGTEIGEALRSTFALAQPHDADLLLITDGHVWETERLIRSAQVAGQRIFAVGIGAAPASSLLHELATRTGGACELVATGAEIEAAIARTVRRMRQSSVRELGVRWDAPQAWQSDPGTVLFGGETVHVFAGFAGARPGSAALAWNDGATPRCERSEVGAMQVITGDTLPRMAAAARLRSASQAEQHALAIQYQLVTASTRLIVVHRRDAGQRARDVPALRIVPQMLAAGSCGSLTCDLPAVRRRAPAVWRRESASHTIEAMMERELLHRTSLLRFLDAVAAMGQAQTPRTLDEVAPQLPAAVLAQLRSIAQLGLAEAEIIATFIDALQACQQHEGFARRWGRKLLLWGAEGALRRRVRRVARQAYHARDPSSYDIPAFLRKAGD